MKALLDYFNDGYGIADLLVAMIAIAAVIACLEKAFQWLCRCFNHLYKKRRGQEDEALSIDSHTSEIRKLSEGIDSLAELISSQYSQLNKKIDEQQKRITLIDKEGKARDCAILRDRILGGIRHFERNKDENGFVHISFSDHENMEHLFMEYFNCSGNGTVKSIYENDFKNWIIDK